MGEDGEGCSAEYIGGTFHGVASSVGTSVASLVGGLVCGVSAGGVIVVLLRLFGCKKTFDITASNARGESVS